MIVRSGKRRRAHHRSAAAETNEDLHDGPTASVVFRAVELLVTGFGWCGA